jgi:hypothetical protein
MVIGTFSMIVTRMCSGVVPKQRADPVSVTQKICFGQSFGRQCRNVLQEGRFV